jgi:hypothetical protein
MAGERPARDGRWQLASVERVGRPGPGRARRPARCPWRAARRWSGHRRAAARRPSETRGADQRVEHGPGRRRGSPVAADSGACRHPPGRDLCPGAESEPDADALNVPFGGAPVPASIWLVAATVIPAEDFTREPRYSYRIYHPAPCRPGFLVHGAAQDRGRGRVWVWPPSEKPVQGRFPSRRRQSEPEAVLPAQRAIWECQHSPPCQR